jgi:hypothetical protein
MQHADIPNKYGVKIRMQPKKKHCDKLMIYLPLFFSMYVCIESLQQLLLKI